MRIACDTRQQVGKHDNVERYFARNGIETVRRKLDVGDYMVADEDGNPVGNVAVDSKFGLAECYSNLIFVLIKMMTSDLYQKLKKKIMKLSQKKTKSQKYFCAIQLHSIL